MKHFLATSLLIVTAAVAFIGCASKRPLTDIQLYWTPTDDPNELKRIDTEYLRGKNIKLELLADGRTVIPKNEIGMNKEDGHQLPVTTSTNVAQFVTDNIVRVFSEMNVNLQPAKADYTLSGEIKEYYVQENPSYTGTLVVQLQLKKGGKVLWSHLISGRNGRFGRSYSTENYMQTLSDVTIDFSKELVQNRSFVEAFK